MFGVAPIRCAHPQGDVTRFLGPRPGQAYVYRIITAHPLFAEMVTTAKSVGRPNALLIQVAFRNRLESFPLVLTRLLPTNTFLSQQVAN
jgi:hypothetical protein